MIDRPGAELDGERDRARLRELVAVQPQREPRVAARRQVAARLLGVEGSALEEDVRRFREPSRLREHLREEEVDVRVGVRELGRDGCAPSQVATPPAAATARSCASSVSWSSP